MNMSTDTSLVDSKLNQRPSQSTESHDCDAKKTPCSEEMPSLTPDDDSPEAMAFKERALEMFAENASNMQGALDQLALHDLPASSDAVLLSKTKDITPTQEHSTAVDSNTLRMTKATLFYALAISGAPFVGYIVHGSLPDHLSTLGLLSKSHAAICIIQYSWHLSNLPPITSPSPSLLSRALDNITKVTLYSSIASIVITGIASFLSLRKDLPPHDISDFAYLIATNGVLPITYGLRYLYTAYRNSHAENLQTQRLLSTAQESHHDELASLAERKSLFLRTMSHEFRDVAHSALQSLRQVSPPQLMRKAATQQFSASSIALPTTSVSTLHASLKSIHHLSTHLGTIFKLLESDLNGSTVTQMSKAFNMEELLQTVADILGGEAASMNVELVLFEDRSLTSDAYVQGDKGGYRHALISLLKTVLDVASPGAVIEIGLVLTPEETEASTNTVRCCIEITHNPSKMPSSAYSAVSPNANLTARLLAYLGATLTAEEFADGRQTIKVVTKLPRATQSEVNSTVSEVPDSYLDITTSKLFEFAKTLRGMKAHVFAEETSYPAKHIERCLAVWEIEVTRHPLLPDTTLDPQNGLDFVIIDDDRETLLQQLKPFLTASERSTPAHTPGTPNRSLPNTTFIYLTSLARYSTVKDAVHTVLQAEMVSSRLVDVLILLKPAGPRRLFASLQNALAKPSVESRPESLVSTPQTSGSSYFPLYSSMRRDSGLDAPSFTPSPEAADLLKDTQFDKSGPTGTVITQNGVMTGIFFRPPSRQMSSKSKLNPTASPNVLIRHASVEALPHLRKKQQASSPGRNSRHDSPAEGPPPVPPPSAVEVTSAENMPTALPAPTATPPAAHVRKAGGRRGISKVKSERVAGGVDSIVPRIKVLIVEDNPINQTILSTFMRKRKIKYSVASNGQEAVDKWKAGGFHLVLMDIQLPVMDGIQATKEIRRLEQSNNVGVYPSTPPISTERLTEPFSSLRTPWGSDVSVFTTSHRSPVIIVALTASSLQSDRHAALAAGCNDFLTKPVSLVWLEKKIIEWGCMQALIDFEGYKRWKAADQSAGNTTTSTGSAPNGSGHSTSNLSEKLNQDRSKPVNGDHGGALTASSSMTAALSATGQENAQAVASRLRIDTKARRRAE